MTPIRGWLNFDNSLSVRLARYGVITSILNYLGFMKPDNLKLISIARSKDIRYADAVRRIPLPDDSVEVLYSSHMLEHLDRNSAKKFIKEAYRVLQPQGIIRICVPDLRKMIERYIHEGDADAFLEQTLLAKPDASGIVERIHYLVVGDRHHKWMYDDKSLRRLLIEHGFRHVDTLPPGSTSIPEPGELDLFEREEDSLYIEAIK